MTNERKIEIMDTLEKFKKEMKEVMEKELKILSMQKVI